ncbi:S1/P1 nuclease [Psychroflexus sp. ALD_RP9]|uniref:S1/P1 nuclease n=1 Tax=Psychroflexus sp. ALD_RP9 TaxID=2777186 RepID=UPI001A8F8647|nr:S1/P1 nuclease [Psychroflexus sp. ALD_RP9]QSS97519.1 S1/P1 nuclease [Psychroflexus sp. ALD_RP9]
MKLILLSLVLNFSVFANPHLNYHDWGQNGHRVVGEVAEQYLTKRAKRKISKLLDGQSLAVISTYADEIKSNNKFDKFKPWHYANVDFHMTYLESKPSEKGDIVIGIKKCFEVLKDKKASKSDKVFYLKMLVHLIGDMHQPLHFGKKEDRGANDFKVKWFYKNSNMHRVWDTEMIRSYNMSYSELADNLDPLSKHQLVEIQKGSLLDWVEDTRELTIKVYNSAEANENLSYKYMYQWFEVVKLQLNKGGIRLAIILNEIFG